MLFYEKNLLAAASGEVIDIADVPDPVFCEKMLGEGYAIKPREGDIFSPVSGTVIDVADTFHAYSIASDDGLEILVHIGIDTVSMGGEGFSPLVSKGEKVGAGSKIALVNLQLIESRGLATHIPVVITNSDRLKKIKVKKGTAQGGSSKVLFYQS